MIGNKYRLSNYITLVILSEGKDENGTSYYNTLSMWTNKSSQFRKEKASSFKRECRKRKYVLLETLDSESIVILKAKIMLMGDYLNLFSEGLFENE